MPTLPTAFVARQGSRVRLDGGQLVVDHPDHPAATLPLGQIGAVVALGGIEFTTPALVALAERGIGCALATRSGRMRAAIVSPNLRHSALRAAQHRLESERAALDSGLPGARALAFARTTIRSKVDAQLGVLSQHHRTHDDVDLADPIAVIRALRDRTDEASSIDRLRGFEGAAAARYFGAMPALCRTELTTSRRTRMPPQDEINAALSFGYSLVVNEVVTTLHARGLDPTLGILHPPADGRPSLALDLVEPLRHAIVDRLVLRAANRRELTPSDFQREPATDDDGGGVRLTDAGRARFLGLYHEAMGASLGGGDPSTRRAARQLIAGVVENYEAAILGGESHPPPLSESLPDAVAGSCDSTSSSSSSTFPFPRASIGTAS